MEEIELTSEDFTPPLVDKFLIVDVGDIFDEIHRVIHLNGEVPVHDVHGDNTDMFLMDIYHEIVYMPFGPTHAHQSIENVLSACGSYFDQPTFTGLQKELWRKATLSLATRFHEYRLYDHTHVNRYDYHQLQGSSLVLKLYE